MNFIKTCSGPVAAIDWSNVPDYLGDPSTFVEFALRCGGPQTVHTVHSVGWTNLVYGASIVDYAFAKVWATMVHYTSGARL